jgi:hypothetical protein
VRTNWFRLITILLVNLLLYRCDSSPVEVTGGASGTDVSACMIKGVVYDSLNHPVDQALIRLRPQYYLSSSSMHGDTEIVETVVDLRSGVCGTFRIDSVVPGEYMLEITNCKYGFSCLCTVRNDDTLIMLPQCIIRGMAEITGKLPLSPEVLQTNDIHLEVYGSENRVEVNTNGIFTMTMPGGNYWMRVCLSESDTTEFDFPVKTRPGEHLDLGIIDVRRDYMNSGPPRRREPLMPRP